MLLLQLQRKSREPLHQQIARQIIQLVESNALCPGELLPASREFARTLGVSRFTVAEAYSALRAQGYTESRQGSYTVIRARPKRVNRAEQAKTEDPPELPLSKATAALCAYRDAAAIPQRGQAGIIDFTSLQADSRLFPIDDLRREFAHVLQQAHAELLNYSDPMGYFPLRQYIASRMQRHGAEVAAENVLITHGSLQGLALMLRLLVNPGQAVAIEQPTFSGAIGLMRMHGLRALGVPMLPEGLDLGRLEKLLRHRIKAQRPALIYTIPTFHNPTGITTSQSQREQLLALCEHHTLPIIEDGFQEEFTFFDRVVQPIKAMDRQGLVFYLGTFSKVFAPGLRIGWIAARHTSIRQLTLLKYTEDLSCSPLLQAALHRYCASGAYEAHLRRMNRIVASRLRHAMALLESELPPKKVKLLRPSGGYLLWLDLEAGATTESRLLKSLAQHNVSAAPSSLFYSDANQALGLRLSISSLDLEQIEQGIRRLGKAIRAALK